MSLSTTSKWFLNTFRDGDSTTSVGSPFQCLTTLAVKKCFLISNLNLPWHNLRPFPLVLSPVRRDQPHSAVSTFQVMEESNNVSPQPPLPQTKEPQFLQLLLIGHILQALHKPCCPSLDLLQNLDVPSVLTCPKLNTVLEVRPHVCMELPMINFRPLLLVLSLYTTEKSLGSSICLQSSFRYLGRMLMGHNTKKNILNLTFVLFLVKLEPSLTTRQAQTVI